MAGFLTTIGTSQKIEEIIIDSKKFLYLVSPYLKISKTFYERLKDADNRGVEIKIIYGKDELKPQQKNSLAKLVNLELIYFENLHAKCYFNENSMVITSMNMYETSKTNNREMGVIISKDNDPKLFTKAQNETNSIIDSSEIIELKKTARRLKTNSKQGKKPKSSKKPKRGYCIRCEDRIPYKIEKPYCIDCFYSWSKYENIDYEENVCHGCGEIGESSMALPDCYDCYKRFEK